jgi:hypothetical protein
VPVDEEPKCETPGGDSDTPCAKLNEFNKCILCSTGYKLTDEGECELEDKDLDEEDEEDNGEDEHEVVKWSMCKVGEYTGWECKSDSQVTCWYINHPDYIDLKCPLLNKLFYDAGMESNCKACPPAPIEHCKVQNGDECVECEEDYETQNGNTAVCKPKAVECPKGTEENISGNCVEPIQNCEDGLTLEQQGGTYCKQCMPGFENKMDLCNELPDPENCEEVEMATPKKCLVCEKGFDQLDNDKTDENCYRVPDFCVAHGTNGCETCEDGYDVATSGECAHRDVMEGCLKMKWGSTATGDKCEECDEGFLLEAGMCAEKTRDVDANCASADEWGWCTECAEE